MKVVDGNLVMDDGTSYYAFDGRIGLREDLEVSYGADGMVGEFDYDLGATKFPPAHRREIADYMIALWTRFRDQDSPFAARDAGQPQEKS